MMMIVVVAFVRNHASAETWMDVNALLQQKKSVSAFIPRAKTYTPALLMSMPPLVIRFEYMPRAAVGQIDRCSPLVDQFEHTIWNRQTNRQTDGHEADAVPISARHEHKTDKHGGHSGNVHWTSYMMMMIMMILDNTGVIMVETEAE